MEFTNINFGYASAEKESIKSPELLKEGFFNLNDISEKAVSGDEFLFLGYKGSGKSSLSEHLRLVGDGKSQLFVNTSYLADFPYTDFKKIIKGDTEPEAKYPTAWSWILCIKLINSFSKDNGSESHSDHQFSKAMTSLHNLGLLPLPSLKHLVLTSSKKSFGVNLGKILKSDYQQTCEENSLQIPFFTERLKEIAFTFKSESRHLLIIDGLDDILSKRSIQYESIAALILEVGRLNLEFFQNGTPAKIILLCRTDLFEKLPGANKNKIRQDSSVNLDWYHDPRKPGRSNLINLINYRSHQQNSNIVDVINTFFKSKTMNVTEEFLLDLTRHTPRDFIQVMKHIQQFTKSKAPTRDEIFSGVRDYSINYFLPEVKDELVGYIDQCKIDKILNAIGSLRKRDFNFSELLEIGKEDRISEECLKTAIFTLFDCSAIGNIHNRPGGTTYYTFKFRNRNSTLNIRDRLILHKGMWKAMNLV